MKKKLMTTLSAAVMAGALFSGAVSAKEENSKKSLTALGDSITFGYNLEQHNQRVSKDAFPFVMGDYANLRVRDLGVPGWKTQDLLNALETNEKFRQAVAHADYITLDIGSNDLLQAFSDYNVTDDEVQSVLEKLSKIASEIRELSDAPVVVYNIYNPFQVDDPRHDIGNLLLRYKVNPQIESLVHSLNQELNNIVLADAFTAYGEKQAEYVLPNDIHPTIEGQKVLAEIGLKALHLEE
ncbi:SGNH/GDSL hydrolase family protein [Bacillus songklensis]|uniref:SGNH/GDSL hydrolase family protein n=1 Tax=Bacillus songklensis TaxID=1069116 RepID=A0ABV8B9R3_9BACI